MKVSAELTPTSDSFNSYPPDVQFKFTENEIKIILQDEQREISFIAHEMFKLMQTFQSVYMSNE
jgi:hypothetical protein